MPGMGGGRSIPLLSGIASELNVHLCSFRKANFIDDCLKLCKQNTCLSWHSWTVSICVRRIELFWFSSVCTFFWTHVGTVFWNLCTRSAASKIRVGQSCHCCMAMGELSCSSQPYLFFPRRSTDNELMFSLCYSFQGQHSAPSQGWNAWVLCNHRPELLLWKMTWRYF